MEISAKQAREIANRNYVWSSLAKEFFSWVRNESESGQCSGKFFTEGKHFDDYELNKLEKLGYSFIWNRACLWYEVYWTE